jgi:type IV pilus assembly protein PilE
MTYIKKIKPANSKGFTLIELMISMVIVGILVTISLPLVQSYFIKSQHAAALKEIMSGKASMEISFYEELAVTSASQISLLSSTQHCSSISATNNLTAGTAQIDCTILGSPAILGAVVSLKRSNDGLWGCSSTAPAEYTANCR